MNSNYTIIKELGCGAMGKVMLATDSRGQQVALKMLLRQYANDQLYRNYFERECRTLSRMAHPSVVGVVGQSFTDAEGNMYLPMQYVQGININQYVDSHGVMNERQAARYMVRILEAFQYIHANGLVHRDVKPSNIMVTGDESVCIIDFGIVRDNSAPGGGTTINGAPVVVGTHGYMSPEQLSGLHVDHRSDIYALGCLLHYMLTGQHAVSDNGDEHATRMQISEGAFPSAQAINSSVSSTMQAIIYKSVDKNMLKRFQNAHEFIVALLPFTGFSYNDVINGKSMSSDPLCDMPMGSWTLTVGKENCDIYTDEQYASRQHLDLILSCEPRSTGGLKRRVTIVDHSTNGTTINGYTYHNTSVKYDLDQRRYISICPAGGKPLDWNRIEVLLLNRISAGSGQQVPPVTEPDEVSTTQYVHDSKPRIPSDVSDTHPGDGFSVGWMILSILTGVVGFILFLSWRKRYPKRALFSCLIPSLPMLTYQTLVLLVNLA